MVVDTIVAFDAKTGSRLGRLPAESWAWSQQVGDSGSVKVTVPISEQWASLDIGRLTEPWRTVLAVVNDGRVVHAGPVFQPEWDADSHRLTILCGGFWDFLKRRLVIPYTQHGFSGGIVQGSTSEGYPHSWRLEYRRHTLGSIARALIAETLRWGPLPVVLPNPEVGLNERTYLGPDLVTVAQRISELTEVGNGPEILFAPRLRDGGRRLEWIMQWGSPELVLEEHRWDMRLPSQPITSLKVNGDSALMTGDAWAKGGSQNDDTLLAHSADTWLTNAGWPLLQTADSSHATVSELGTLTGYTKAAIQSRGHLSYTVSFRARRTDELGRDFAGAVTIGDHIHLRVEDPYLGDTRLSLKVLEMSGDQGEWVTFATRPTIEWE